MVFFLPTWVPCVRPLQFFKFFFRISPKNGKKILFILFYYIFTPLHYKQIMKWNKQTLLKEKKKVVEKETTFFFFYQSKDRYLSVEIRFRISRSIAIKSEVRILKSESRFPKRKHPNTILPSKFIAKSRPSLLLIWSTGTKLMNFCSARNYLFSFMSPWIEHFVLLLWNVN